MQACISLYIRNTDKAGIVPNPRCEALTPKLVDLLFWIMFQLTCVYSDSQMSIKSLIQNRWSREGLKDHIVELIVCEDEVSSFLLKPQMDLNVVCRHSGLLTDLHSKPSWSTSGPRQETLTSQITKSYNVKSWRNQRRLFRHCERSIRWWISCENTYSTLRFICRNSQEKFLSLLMHGLAKLLTHTYL